MRFTLVLACVGFIVSQLSTTSADDWPELRGKGRLGRFLQLDSRYAGERLSRRAMPAPRSPTDVFL